MGLPSNLNTNEVKDRAGTEVEFTFFDDSKPRSREWQRSNQAPYLIESIKVQHRDVGKPGFFLVRQSNLRIVKNVLSLVDNSTIVPIISSHSLQIPIGALTTFDAVKDVVAYHNTLMATINGTTVLFDGTGTAAAAMIAGTV
jgi:hypothetical protein